ncbi:hypothetical protein N658DRAFT_491587 [Parathielavia hyrcaniae]|uniref:Uncharacterized protein n=1 Tax=Parathielavia hyrcaniae TaxID=113614 RepID=A0AAN6QB57_9PEZI|nr:hypothetical protein N658DRAFT_491587 [Parathielavia hyrcaniae]
MASLGALTTTFTPPASCALSTGIHIVGCGDACVWWAEGPLNSPAASACYPSSYDPSLGHYYSPGVCPSGYTAACTSRRTSGDVTETIQTCCPTALGYAYHCDQPTFPWQSSLACNVYMSDPTSTFDFATVTSIRDGRTVITSTARTEVGIGAYGVEIRFQARDFASSTETTATTSPSATDTSTSASTPATASTPLPTPATDDGSTSTTASSTANTNTNTNTNANDDSTSSSSSNSGLSAAASAGIGVGAAIGTLLILGLGIFFGRRSVQRRKREAGAGPHAAAEWQSMSEYKLAGGEGYLGRYDSAYPPAQQQAPGELSATMPPAELQGHAVVHELGSPDAARLGWGQRR